MKLATIQQALFCLPLFSTALATSCRYLPGDSGWPTAAQWRALNATVEGRLIATVPLGSPCHDPSYNAATCASYQSQWQDVPIHLSSSSSVMAPFFANQSCDPFTPRSKPCTLGNYVSYSINATCPGDVIAAVNFAQARNIRFVVRNTGHDYNGRSTGAGALAIWTHYLKDTQIIDWSDAYYTGKAIKMGAGIQGYEAMAAAKVKGLVAIGGECPTVGVAGGYTQGGGHSALSTSFGLGADQTLSFDVVLADGSLVTATRTKNSDLYWALSGGGGGTYGVVVSMTSKAYPDTTVSGASLVFLSSTTTADNFYAGVSAFHSLLPAMVDAGGLVIYYFSDQFFQIGPFTGYNKTQAQVETILAPFVKALTALGIQYSVTYSQSATYTEHYDKYFGPLPFGNIQVGIAQYGGRLIPRTTITQNNAGFMNVARNITQNGVLFIGVATDVSPFASKVSNAVLPAWRKALIHATLTTPWNFTAPWADMIALQDKMTNVVVPQLEAVTPGSGVYMNEADFRQPNWQDAFFGANYAKLLSIKKKYDPNRLLWSLKTVGSEYWTVANNGRMCKA
ncbi:FAD binding domain protein [Bisporella sp. PMI_857]|nr:FAD binding domain protein [Bisporella sp. PMI_857]